MVEIKPVPFIIDAPVAGYLFKAKNPKAQILLQHGYGEYTTRYVTQYSKLIPKLVERGFDVYGIDLEGHGNTAGERGLIDVQQAVEHHLLARAAMPTTLPTFLFDYSLEKIMLKVSPKVKFFRIVTSTLVSWHQARQRDLFQPWRRWCH